MLSGFWSLDLLTNTHTIALFPESGYKCLKPPSWNYGSFHPHLTLQLLQWEVRLYRQYAAPPMQMGVALVFIYLCPLAVKPPLIGLNPQHRRPLNGQLAVAANGVVAKYLCGRGLWAIDQQVYLA